MPDTSVIIYQSPIPKKPCPQPMMPYRPEILWNYIYINIYILLLKSMFVVNIRTVKWTVHISTVRGQYLSFSTQERVLLRNVDILEAENVSTQKVKPPTFEFMPNALPFELQGPGICYPMFWNTCPCGIDILLIKFTFETSIVTVRGQQYSCMYVRIYTV